MKHPVSLKILTLIVLIWCVAIPYLWVFNFAAAINIDLIGSFQYFAPELITSLLALMCLIGLYTKQSWVVTIGLFSAVLLPILKTILGSPTIGAWLITSLLMVVLSWQVAKLKKLKPYA
ncbi:hypothetical protein [Flocculibacter collagenilyticus]|uniref:hypothetical protein n=1 Tax=Flocculibacter collagenilyticus TaxID=2744479 RepID=UPI0018F6AC7C|nr:hypothetical protein [Flocculibacter collagenilyticus]